MESGTKRQLRGWLPGSLWFGFFFSLAQTRSISTADYQRPNSLPHVFKACTAVLCSVFSLPAMSHFRRLDLVQTGSSTSCPRTAFLPDWSVCFQLFFVTTAAVCIPPSFPIDFLRWCLFLLVLIPSLCVSACHFKAASSRTSLVKETSPSPAVWFVDYFMNFQLSLYIHISDFSSVFVRPRDELATRTGCNAPSWTFRQLG